MRKTSGDLHIVDFKSKRIIASLKPEDYFEDLRHWEIKDNADILDFKLLEDSPFLDYIQQHNLVLKETRPGVIVPYVITSTEKDSDAHTVTIYASGEWISLDKDNYLSPQTINSWSAEQYMLFATARNEWEVGVIEAVGKRSFVITEFTSPLKFIHQIAVLFDNVEIQYRIVMNTNKPPTRFIDLVKKRGRETNKEITLGKDLLGVKRLENSENVITALVPFIMGKDADGNEKMITIESVNNGLQYIVDDAAYQRWNVDGKHRFGFYTPESENEDMTPARLLTLAKTELKKRVDTIVTYEVDSVDISRVFQYEHEQVNEGDTIHIIDEGMTPTLYLEARAIAGDESHKDPRQNKYTFGNFVEIVNQDEILNRLYQKMLAMIGDKVSKEWFAALEDKVVETENKANTAVEESQTAKDLAEATKEYMDQNMVDIIEGVNPPTTDLKPNKTLWRDISGGRPGILKIWTGTIWETVAPDVEEVKRELELTNDALKSKISDKQMHDYIGNLGTTNILINSIFEKKTIDKYGNVLNREPSIEKWETNAGSITGVTVQADKVKNFSGSNSVSIISSGQTSEVYANVYQTVQVVAGAIDYVLSTRIYTNNLAAIDGDVTADVIFYNGGNKVDGKQIDLKPLLKNNEWQLATLKVQAPSTGITSAKIHFTVEKNGALWVSEPQLQQGIEPSTFMPNPKDITNYGEMIDTIAGKVAQSEYNQKISLMDTQIEQNSQAITLKASSEDVYTKVDSDGKYGDKAIVERHESQIKLNSQEISLRVKEGDIASTINQTAQSVLIQADKIYLNGFIEAKHLKAQELVGVTIKTAPSNENRFVQLNKQFIELYDKNISRLEMKFFNNSANNAIIPAIVLGRSQSGGIEGASVWYHNTPLKPDGTDDSSFSSSTLGIVQYYNSTSNQFTYAGSINFARNGAISLDSNDNVNISASQQGHIFLKTDTVGAAKSIFVEPSLNFNVTAGNQVQIKSNNSHFYSNNNGSFTFENTGKTTGNQMMLSDNNTDADLRLAFIRIRASHVTGYQSSLQLVPTGTNTATAGLQCGRIDATMIKCPNIDTSSTRKIKSNIRDIEIDSIEKIMSLKIQQYNFKSDVEKLYEMRQTAVGTGTTYTTNDIPLQYGFVAEDTDSVFTTDEKDAIRLYTLISLDIDATQKIKLKQDDHDVRIARLEKEIEVKKLKEVDQEKRITALEELIQKLIN
ncbi:peptidase S74 [Bacillus cereus]|nr:peptidase S74 [Bacillus cereus]